MIVGMQPKLTPRALAKWWATPVVIVAVIAVLCACVGLVVPEVQGPLEFFGLSVAWLVSIYILSINTEALGRAGRLIVQMLKLGVQGGGVVVFGVSALLFAAVVAVAAIMVVPSGRAWLEQAGRQQFIGDCVRLRHGTTKQCTAAAKCDGADDGEEQTMCERRPGVWGQYRDELRAGRPLPEDQPLAGG
jgi:hypothetical protein